jgi:phosphoribosylamine-glycine ligase
MNRVNLTEEEIRRIVEEAEEEEDYEGYMEIEVTETVTVDGREVTVKAVVDEYEFIRLYGEQDFRMLIAKGKVGDTIGEKKTYYARLLTIKTP